MCDPSGLTLPYSKRSRPPRTQQMRRRRRKLRAKRRLPKARRRSTTRTRSSRRTITKIMKKTYTAAQDAPVADQYAVAKDQLTAALAGRDTLGSSGGNNALAMLSKTNADTQAQIGQTPPTRPTRYGPTSTIPRTACTRKTPPQRTRWPPHRTHRPLRRLSSRRNRCRP